MSDENLPVTPKGPNGLDQTLQPTTPRLDQVPDMSEDEVLALTRKLRIRQLAIELNNNGGEFSTDPEEKKIQLAMLKDLDNQATKIKMIGAKEKATAADREASLAVHRMLQMLGDNPMRRQAPIEGEVSRPRPSIKDAENLKPLQLVPDETQIGLDTTSYEELMERNGE